MRLGLLGVDAKVLELLGAVPEGVRLESVCEVPAWAEAEVQRLAPQVRREESWAQLLVGGLDAVVVARGPEPAMRVDQVRRLAAEGARLVVSHPLSLSPLDLYEIDLARREGNAVIVPWLPGRRHPAIAQLENLIDAGEAGPIGAVEQIVFARALAERRMARVLESLAVDLDVLRALGGDLNRVIAMGPRDPEAAANLAVHLAGPSGQLAQWSVEPATEEVQSRLELVGTRGRARLYMPEHSGAWRLELTGPTDKSTTYPPWHPAPAALEALAEALAGEAPDPDWTDVIRSVELVEAVQRSLARGKQVELRWDENAEATNFKSTMTALGCSLLVVSVAVIVAAAVGQKVAEALGFVWLAARLGQWPWWLLAALVIFLGLQALRLVVVDRPEPGPGAALSGEDANGDG